MERLTLIDEIKVTWDTEELGKPAFYFVVFSSREKHIEITIDCIERAVKEVADFQIIRLSESLKSEDSQYGGLIEYLRTCAFAVVILDGLRPNVIFEYGILKGLRKPCIILLEKDAEIDIDSYFHDREKESMMNLRADLDKDFSDIKDRTYKRYDKNNPKEAISVIRNELAEIRTQIDNELVRMILPDKDIIEHDVKTHLGQLAQAIGSGKSTLSETEKNTLKDIVTSPNKTKSNYRFKFGKTYYDAVVDALFRHGLLEEAISTLNLAIGENPKNPRYFSLKADVLCNMERYDEAMEAIQKGFQIDDAYEPLWHMKGILHEIRGEKDEGLICFKRGVEFTKRCQRIHYHYGVALFEMQQFEAALEQFDTSIELSPVNPQALLWKAKTLTKLKRRDEARIAIDAAISFSNADADAWFILGNLAEDTNESIRYYDKALSLDPTHGGAKCSKAAQLSNSGLYEEALKELHDAKTLCPVYASCEIVLATISITLTKAGRSKEALKFVDDLIALSPTNIAAISARADILALLNEIPDAISQYRKAIALKPDHGRSLFGISAVLAQTGEKTESLQYLKKAIEINPSFRDDAIEDRNFDKIRDDQGFKLATQASDDQHASEGAPTHKQTNNNSSSK